MSWIDLLKICILVGWSSLCISAGFVAVVRELPRKTIIR